MATNTTNYNLTKPDVDDFYDVNQFNQNADIIDSQLKNNADSIEAIRINDLTALPPVEATLNSGKNTLTTEHDSTARVTAFEGDTIINYVPPFDSGLFAADNGYTINSPTKMTLNAIAAQNYLKQVTISVKQNTNYYVSCKHNGNIGIYNADGSTPIVYYTESQGFGFNSGNNSQIRLYFRNKNNTIGIFTFENALLMEYNNLPSIVEKYTSDKWTAPLGLDGIVVTEDSVTFDLTSATVSTLKYGYKAEIEPKSMYGITANIEQNDVSTTSVLINEILEDGTVNWLNQIYPFESGTIFTITTSSNAKHLQLVLNSEGTDINVVFRKIQASKLDGEKPFVANVQGITNPTIENTTTGDSITLLGTFHNGDVVSEDKGQYSVLRVKREVVLDGSLAWQFVKSETGLKQVTANVTSPNGFKVGGLGDFVKFNGKILSIADVANQGDTAYTYNTNGNVYLRIPSADSGWGNYTPTANEIKAYFLGWVMYDGTKAADAIPGIDLYNGGPSKWWAYRTDWGGWGGATTTLPTTQAPINSKWKPYKLVYHLANPVKEQVQAINSVLKLAKGDNVLQVSEGRIVREKVAPQLNTNGTYVINATVNGEISYTKEKVSRFINVYKNGEVDSNWTFVNRTDTNGSYAYIQTSNYESTAVYTVDYEPLYPFKVTAPSNPITIKYQSNLASLVTQNVEDIVELKEDVAVIKRDMVIKGEGAEWFNFTMLGGWTGTIKARKFSTDIVELYIELVNVGATANNTLVGRLPVELSPTYEYIVPMFKGNSSPYDAANVLRVRANGEILLLGGFSIPTGTTAVNIRGSVLMVADSI